MDSERKGKPAESGNQKKEGRQLPSLPCSKGFLFRSASCGFHRSSGSPCSSWTPRNPPSPCGLRLIVPEEDRKGLGQKRSSGMWQARKKALSCPRPSGKKGSSSPSAPCPGPRSHFRSSDHRQGPASLPCNPSDRSPRLLRLPSGE